MAKPIMIDDFQSASGRVSDEDPAGSGVKRAMVEQRTVGVGDRDLGHYAE
jgi:hypothetical protein